MIYGNVAGASHSSHFLARAFPQILMCIAQDEIMKLNRFTLWEIQSTTRRRKKRPDLRPGVW
jgi:hypothetical protein